MLPRQCLVFYATNQKTKFLSALAFELHCLTPKGPRGVFLKKRSKSAISSSRSPNEMFFTFLHF
jgi:hypothetical protein